MRDFLLRLAREDEGHDLIQYALLAGASPCPRLP